MNEKVAPDFHELIGKLLFLILFTYLFHYAFYWGKTFPFFLGMLLVFYRWVYSAKPWLDKWFWTGAAFLLGIEIGMRFYRVANHHFLLFFTVLLYLQSLWYQPGPRLKFFRSQARILLIVLLSFVCLQKFASPNYMSGEYFSYMVITGKFFIPLPQVVVQYADWATANEAIFNQVAALNPGPDACLSYENSALLPQLHKAGQVLSYLVLVTETFALAIVAFARNQKLIHGSVIFMVVSVLLARPECGFLSLVCLMGLNLCEGNATIFRRIYIFLIVLFSSLIATTLVYF